MFVDEKGNPIFSKDDQQRLKGYAVFENLYKYKHKNTIEYYGFRELNQTGKSKRLINIAINFPGLMSRAFADLLFGEPAKIYLQGANEKTLERFNYLMRKNNLNVKLWSSEVQNSYRGDDCIKLCVKKGEAAIEFVPAYNYFPVPSIDNMSEAETESLAWYRGNETAMVVSYEEADGGTVIDESICRAKISEKGNVALGEVLRSVTTLYPCKKMLFHVPNSKVDNGIFGYSDYYDLVPLFEAVNNRMSNIDSYLDNHSRPKLVGVEGMSDITGEFDTRTDYIEPTDPSFNDKIRYLVWDGKLESAFKQLEILEEKIFQIAELSPAIFGFNIGSSIDSAMAMRQFFTRTKAKINRKRMIYDNSLKELIENLMLLDGFLEGYTPEYQSIEILWQDGIPQDINEAARTEQIRMESGTTSAESAIMRLEGCTREAAQQELARRREEARSLEGADQGQAESV